MRLSRPPLASHDPERGHPCPQPHPNGMRPLTQSGASSVFSLLRTRMSPLPRQLRYALLVFALAVLNALCGCSHSTAEATPKPAPPVSVHLLSVKKGEATRSITLPGNVLAYQQAILYAKVAGYVKTVAVDKGDSVPASALLADIEVPELIAERAEYQAELEVAALDYKRISDEFGHYDVGQE